MKVLVFFIALTFYLAVSNAESKPSEPVPIVYVLPRKRLRFPRRRCSNLVNIGIIV
ncbi:MAG TPA: hypothetical protein VLX91_10840 [Candidatus Acidoferrales bacterium]|nr:hypothetical protein [Candidatus Acidoferrales bacterium]